MPKRQQPYGPQLSVRPLQPDSSQAVDLPCPGLPQTVEKVRGSYRQAGLLAATALLIAGTLAFGCFQVSQAWPGLEVGFQAQPFTWQPASQDVIQLALTSPIATAGALPVERPGEAPGETSLRADLPSLPERQEDLALKARLQSFLAKIPPSITPHIYMLNLETGSYVNLQGDEPVPAASVIKLPVLLAYFQDVEAGTITWQTPWTYEPLHQAGGSGELQYKPPGQAYPSIDLATIMIQASDNTATNILIDNLGGSAALDNRLNAWGLSHTYVRNWLPDLQGTNTISPREMARILYTILESKTLSESNQLKALDILTHIHNNRLIPAGLAPAVRKQLLIAHKTGDIGTALGDSAWIRLPDGQRYLLCIQAQRTYNDGTAKTMIQQLSQQVYTAVASGSAVLKNADLAQHLE